MICSIPAIATYFGGIKSTETLGAPLWIDSAPKFILYMLVTGTHMAPFWFIPMIAIVYLVSPVLVQLDRLPRGYGIIAPLLLSLVVGRSPGVSNPVQNFAFYLPAYVIGMAVSHYRDRLIPQLAQYCWLFLPFIALPLIDVSAQRGLDSVELVTKIVFCLGLIGAFARYAHDLLRWVDYLGSVSFGLYFLHCYAVAVLAIAAKLRLHAFFLQGIAAYALVVIGVTGAFVVAVMIAKAILGARSRRRMTREGVIAFVAKLPGCVVAMEACCGTHFLGRTFQAQGHEVRLMAPEYVQPYVKAQKTDDRDAEAIVEAATRPTMRLVTLMSEAQLDL